MPAAGGSSHVPPAPRPPRAPCARVQSAQAAAVHVQAAAPRAVPGTDAPAAACRGRSSAPRRGLRQNQDAAALGQPQSCSESPGDTQPSHAPRQLRSRSSQGMRTGGGSGRWGPQCEDPCPRALVPSCPCAPVPLCPRAPCPCAAGGGAELHVVSRRQGGQLGASFVYSARWNRGRVPSAAGSCRREQGHLAQGPAPPGLWRGAAPLHPAPEHRGDTGMGGASPSPRSHHAVGQRGPRNEGLAPPGLGALGSGDAAQPSCHGWYWCHPCLPGDPGKESAHGEGGRGGRAA